MSIYQLGDKEAVFADIIWENEPINSSVLSDMAAEKLGWKKPTSFNVLRRLCDKGIFTNEKTVVTSLVSREEFYARKSEIFVKENFNNSLPMFIASFIGKRKLTKEEAEELYRLVDEYSKPEETDKNI